MAAFTEVDELVSFLASLDGVFDVPPPYGDPVDLRAHGLQCAAVLRGLWPDDVGLQLAGLVHDVGHACGADDPDHARVGGEVVRPVLGDRVADLVALHVQAKRFLAATEDYKLSEASRLTLERQGSAMRADEQLSYLALPAARDAITLRRADEAAKVVGLDVPGLERWAPVMREYVAGLSGSRAHPTR